MLSPIIRRPRRNQAPRSDERGVTIALVAAAMVAIIAMAALSIDIGTLYQAKAEAQRAADVAALTAARVISISGITGDPNNSAASWQPTCGGSSSTATLAATAIAQAQANFVGGSPIPAAQVKVTYGAGSAGASNSDCTGLGQAFAVNPVVTVKVQQTNLPIFFARVFSLVGGNFSSTTASATATAEVFNPSNSAAYASGSEVVPVQPRCVKPWIVPNSDPLNPVKGFVNPDGSIVNPGISPPGPGVIGEEFNLIANCAGATAPCVPAANPPKGLSKNGQYYLPYFPGLVPASTLAAPSCATANPYQEAVGGCDQTTIYQCGVLSSTLSSPNRVDLTENPSGPSGDSDAAAQCLIHEASAGAASGQDQLVTTAFPFQIQAGSSNPQGVSGMISGSDSIVSMPIYDGTALPGNNQAPVTIVGFLQVFINQVNADPGGTVSVYVLNVAGCGNTVSAKTQALTGTSPVPVRLITPP